LLLLRGLLLLCSLLLLLGRLLSGRLLVLAALPAAGQDTRRGADRGTLAGIVVGDLADDRACRCAAGGAPETRSVRGGRRLRRLCRRLH